LEAETMQAQNIDHDVVAGFGDEWARFDQTGVADGELEELFDQYFAIFPWDAIPQDSVGFDMGCGSGRWARFVAPRVGELHLIDASAEALDVAKRNLEGFGNCRFHLATVDTMPVPDDSFDFGYCLGVLHHLPDTKAALRSCIAKLKPGAPFLLYLYYSFDNRPAWFRAVWRASDVIRGFISRMPHGLRNLLCQGLAGLIYFPAARFSLLAEKAGIEVSKFPLSQYRNSSFYVMRNDALDRFGTRIEKRFSRSEVEELMRSAGLSDIVFGDFPYWTAVGSKAIGKGLAKSAAGR